MPWPRPIIEHKACEAIKIWENARGNENRIVIYLEPESYLIVLAKRRGYLLPWTAYFVERDHRRRKLLKEYNAFVEKAGVSS
jgi:hypothetical protein